MSKVIRKLLYVFLCTGISTTSFCQDWDFDNMVPNPGFEYCHFVPSYYTDSGINFTDAVKNWFAPNKASTDLLSTKFKGLYGKEVGAHSGENMAGISVPDTGWGEYVAVELAWPMTAGQKYYVEFWVAMVKSYLPKGVPQKMSQGFGLLLDYELYEATNKRFRKQPQVTLGDERELKYGEWIKIADTIEASSAYTHLYIGQFDKPTGIRPLNGYFFIDDVKVKDVRDLPSATETEASAKQPESETIKTLESKELLVLDNVYFETSSSTLRISSYPQLDEVVKWLLANPDVTIKVNGHTDSVGNAYSNLALSNRRAEAVMLYFIAKGVSGKRIDVQGFGELKPISDNTTQDGRRKNRRVEIEVLEK
ncbi:MAG: OmpA family protein [Bacteroidota bacterium]